MTEPHQVAIIAWSYNCLQTVLLMTSGLLMAESAALYECRTTRRRKQAA